MFVMGVGKIAEIIQGCVHPQAGVYGWEEVGASLERECGKQLRLHMGCEVGVRQVVFANEELQLAERWEELGIEGGAEVHVAWDWWYVLQGHTGVVYSVASLGDGKLASGSHDMTVRVWGEHIWSCTNLVLSVDLLHRFLSRIRPYDAAAEGPLAEKA